MIEMAAGETTACSTPIEWITHRWKLSSCPICLFLNREDIAAPRWHRDWLAPDYIPCQLHQAPTITVGAVYIQQCRNFTDVLNLVGAQEAWQAWLDRDCPHWRKQLREKSMEGKRFFETRPHPKSYILENGFDETKHTTPR